MRNSQAFSLIELLLAMTISSFIIMGMMQGLALTRKFIGRAHQIMALNRKACLTFNQIERDLNAAFIPILAKTEEEKTEEKKENSLMAKPQEKDLFINFKGTIYEDALFKVAGKKYELFKSISMVCTNPLKVYNERRPNLVRVQYELLPDKEKKQGTIIPYKLIRKETLDLKNSAFKEKELSKKETHLAIRTHLIADNIKEFSIEYVFPRLQEKGKKLEAEEREKKSFVWGKKEASQQHQKKDAPVVLLPQYVNLRLVFYNDALNDTYSYETMCQILSYGSPIQPTYKQDELAKSDTAEALKVAPAIAEQPQVQAAVVAAPAAKIVEPAPVVAQTPPLIKLSNLLDQGGTGSTSVPIVAEVAGSVSIQELLAIMQHLFSKQS